MKAITRLVAVFAASALALGMFGCAASEPEPVETNPSEAQHYTSEEIGASDIAVEKSGFSIADQASKDEEGNELSVPVVNFAFIAKNSNTGYVAENVPFSVTGLTADGGVAFNGAANCSFVYPGIDTAVSGTAELPADVGTDVAIDSISVEPLTANVEWMKTNLSDKEIADMFAVDNAKAERVGSDVIVEAAITGDIADADKVFRIVEIEGTLEGHCVAIFTDAEGNILFGSESTNVLIDQETLDSLKAGDGEDGIMSNMSMMVQNAPDYADFHIYMMPSI